MAASKVVSVEIQKSGDGHFEVPVDDLGNIIGPFVSPVKLVTL
ncbi:hypothetical protein [Bradyrhizobium sp. CSS354]|nr:hypothetical protein [Bradyrhizobium sp. CSS354]